MTAGKSPKRKAAELEKKLQIVFGLAIAAVAIGLIAFVILVIKDIQR